MILSPKDDEDEDIEIDGAVTTSNRQMDDDVTLILHELNALRNHNSNLENEIKVFKVSTFDILHRLNKGMTKIANAPIMYTQPRERN